ncbi:MAG: hypothetical protein O3A00_28115 [Planctomycetota bacterium]|nr:hypothetical protein [Planctomycetota bacterium]
MDDALRHQVHRRRNVVLGLLATGLLTTAIGCSLFVMAGKVIFGDPVQTCEFTHMTGVDLVDSGKRLLIVCSTPHALESHYPAINSDILTGVTRRLDRRGIKVVKADEVASWLDDNGGRWTGADDIIRDFPDVDYIVHIKLEQLRFRVEHSPTLLQGKAVGNVLVHQVGDYNGRRQAVQVFPREFTEIYPEFSPLSTEQRTEKVFENEYLDRLCSVLAQKFYSHRLSEEQE